MQKEKFSFPHDLKLRWRQLDDQFLFYEEQSAVTHVLDEVTGNLLLQIYHQPINRQELIKSVAITYADNDAEEFIDAAILAFRIMGFLN